MDLVTQREDYDSISWNTRLFLSKRMYQLMEQLEPYVDGSMGDVQPGHVQAYVKVAHELGALFETHRRPFEKPEAKGVPVERVQQMLQQQQEQFESQLQAAVVEAEVRTQQRLEVEQAARERLSLEQGRQLVWQGLQATRQRLQG